MPSPSFLDTPIEFLKGVGPQRAELLKKSLEIFTFSDLLHYFPFRYVDRSRFYTIREIRDDMPYIQLKGQVTFVDVAGSARQKRLVARFSDNTGSIELVWFKGIKWIASKVLPGKEYVVFGKPTLFNNRYNIAHPEIDLVGDANIESGKFQPVYNSTEALKSRSLDSRGIGRLIRTLLHLSEGRIPETLPTKLLHYQKYPGRETALMHVHIPPDVSSLEKARQRLKFEELFLIQLKLLQLRNSRKVDTRGVTFPKVGEHFNSFYHDHLPYTLTNAQKRVMKEIRSDLGSGKQMNRLLQGDVGSGKTIVALLSMLLAADNGFQSALLAPTEILANQHLQSIRELLQDMPVRCELLAGSTKQSARNKLLPDLSEGKIQIIIGTHALLEDPVVFKKLGLVIIDEQHRFGVEQRARMWKKAETPPHVLVMTATPIPRTLAMTLYGDLDNSVINEMPPGRKPVKTVHYTDAQRLRVFGFMKDQISQGRQIYVVYPLIQESEKMDYKDLLDGYESISRAFPLPHYKVSIVHGKMKNADKDFEMQRFVKGETQIMVATTVIEVGINVPNASVMVIESAERFGLSQLHQLRGRVGRGADQSFCILMTSDKPSNDARKRMRIMTETTDGFKIAEEDLKLRGPGDLEGTQQSGIPGLRISDLTKDQDLLMEARKIAEAMLEKDPQLTLPENHLLRDTLAKARGEKQWNRIS